jgi:uncharacterized protein YecE (DUF72 family)
MVRRFFRMVSKSLYTFDGPNQRGTTSAGGSAVRVGTAGWSIASRHAAAFPVDGSHLQRYARRLNAVEINSSFYRPHRRETYERWADSVPQHFRFAVKLPRSITHERRLADAEAPLDRFLGEVAGLGGKLGVLLVQTPPNLRFGPSIETFFALLRDRTALPAAIEPRHESWAEAEDLLARVRIARVAADPSRFAGDDRPGGWRGLAYFRLHGAPRIYYSDYGPARLEAFARQIAEAARSSADTWCIFDNTAEGHALPNALAMQAALDPLPDA